MSPNPLDFDAATLQQAWPLPGTPRPIVIVGAGGIVNDAHLPAYRKAGLPVAALVEPDAERLTRTAALWGIGEAVPRLADLDLAGRHADAVFDLALPPAAICPVLEQLPDGAHVLIQKPMGTDLAHARQILQTCRRKRLVAAVNHQLRFAPYMLVVRDLIARGWLGEITDVEMQLNCADPWHLFPFLEAMERVEIQVHSIHYLDLIRSLLGEPQGVYALTIPDARYPRLASTRSSVILNYGAGARVSLSLNHNYAHGEQGQRATFKFEGRQGVAWVQIGVMLDYPKGRPDELQFKHESRGWQTVSLNGSWFPDAFIGPMANLQRFAAGEDPALLTGVEDVIHTMALVEAAYRSSRQGGEPLPDVSN